MLRPGRLGKLLYVPLPSVEDRIGILNALTRKLNVATVDKMGTSSDFVVADTNITEVVSLEAIGADPRTEGFSGADLAELVREAGLAAIKEFRATHVHRQAQIPKESSSKSDVVDSRNVTSRPTMLLMRHFEAALRSTRASVAEGDRKR
jgi:ribosome biogenesis ATPase